LGTPYSLDLRERVVAAVEGGKMSRNGAAAHFGVAISTAIQLGEGVSGNRQLGVCANGRASAQEDRGQPSRLVDRGVPGC
jgi:transposase